MASAIRVIGILFSMVIMMNHDVVGSIMASAIRLIGIKSRFTSAEARLVI